MQSRKLMLTAALTLGAGATATVALATGGSGASESAPTQESVVRVATPLPEAARSQAADTAPMTPTAAQGYQLATRDETVWIVRGDDGSVCLVRDALATCGPDGGGSSGLLSIGAPPPPVEGLRAAANAQDAGLSAAEAAASVREATADAAPVSGPATFVGYIAPERGVETARLVDADGGTLATAQVVDGVYDFRVSDVATADPREIRLEGAALDRPIILGPFPADRL